MSEYADYFIKENEFASKQDDLSLKQQFVYDIVQELIEWSVSATHKCYPEKIDNTILKSEDWDGPSDDLIRSKAWEIIATIAT